MTEIGKTYTHPGSERKYLVEAIEPESPKRPIMSVKGKQMAPNGTERPFCVRLENFEEKYEEV